MNDMMEKLQMELAVTPDGIDCMKHHHMNASAASLSDTHSASIDRSVTWSN